jgi:hypothetical protein
MGVFRRNAARGERGAGGARTGARTRDVARSGAARRGARTGLRRGTGGTLGGECSRCSRSDRHLTCPRSRRRRSGADARSRESAKRATRWAPEGGGELPCGKSISASAECIPRNWPTREEGERAPTARLGAGVRVRSTAPGTTLEVHSHAVKNGRGLAPRAGVRPCLRAKCSPPSAGRRPPSRCDVRPGEGPHRMSGRLHPPLAHEQA